MLPAAGRTACLLVFSKLKVVVIAKTFLPQDGIIWGEPPHVTKVTKAYEAGLPYDSESLFWSLCELIEKYKVNYCSVSENNYLCHENMFALLQSMYPDFGLNVVGRSETSPAR